MESTTTATAAGPDMSADLNRLLQQLQKSVLDDRKAGPKARDAAGAAAASAAEEYPSDIEPEEDEEEEPVIFDQSELQEAMKGTGGTVHVSRWTTGLGSAAAAAAATATLNVSASAAGRKGAGALVLGRSGSNATLDKTKQLLGPPTLMKQLEGVFAELESVATAEPPAGAIPSSPMESPKSRKVTLFGSKKSDKKRLIEKYKAQLEALEGDRRGLTDRVHKAGQTGGVALGMLRQEWAAAEKELQAKKAELEAAHDELARHEAETLQLRTSMLGLRKQIVELQARPPAPVPTPVVVVASPEAVASPEQQQQQQSPASSVGGGELVAVNAAQQARLAQLETELDLAYGKIEALSLQQHTNYDRGSAVVQQLQAELKEAKAQLAARVKKYTELKERVRQLEEELEAAAGANEAIKHQNELRIAKMEERLKESMREALENERTAKSALFKREQAEAEAERLREQYDVLVGQFEAIRSQVELEKLEAQGIVTKYERELEDVYGKLNAKDEYAGLLSGVKRDMDAEMSALWEKVEAAEAAKQQVEAAFVALGTKHREASARRLYNFMAAQNKRIMREALHQWKQKAQAEWDTEEEEDNEDEA